MFSYRVKLFCDIEPEEIEQNINDWFKRNPTFKMVQMTQTVSYTDDGVPLLDITFLYIEPRI